ncbi:MAG: DUF2007 domain-containing protein [Myxococcota bacterium]
MKQIYVATDPVDAELVKGMLAAHAIEATIQGGAVFALRGEIPMTTDTLPTVWVLDDVDFDRARALVDADLQRRAASASGGRAWTCSGCGETLEAQFTHCWRCGRPHET